MYIYLYIMRLNLLDILKRQITEQGGKFKSMVDLQGNTAGDEYASVSIGDDMRVTDVLSKGETITTTTTVDVDSPDLFKGIPGNRGYGMKKHPIYGDMRMHWGTDFANGGMNDAYVIITDGEVLDAVNDRSKTGCGTSVKIKHPDGNCTRVCHLEKLFVSKGDIIKAGTVVGLVGNTGGSTGPHLHWEYSPGCSGASEPPDGSWDNYFRFSKKIDPKIDKIETIPVTNSDQSEEDVTAVGEKKTITKPTYIIDLNNPSSKNIGIIWGGTPSSTYGASFMKKQGESYFTNKNIIYSDHENSVSEIKKYIKKELGDGYTINSVSGFSKGGEKTWGEINSGYDFVGLIDPSTSSARSSLPTNVKMMSNHSNWSYYPNMMKALKKMEESGLSERVGDSKTYNHDNIPKKFFEKYSGNY